MQIIKFEWDNAKGEEHNGKSVIIGQHLNKKQNDKLTHIEIYGISLDIVDDSKDYELKKLSCHTNNICGLAENITKEQARLFLINEIDKALDILYDKTEVNAIDKDLNISEPELK